MTRQPAALLGAAFAPAKINLALHVVGRRADGYHLLDSLVVFASIGDTIEAWAATDDTAAGALDIVGPFAAGLSAGRDNLVLRALDALAVEGVSLPALTLKLIKRLPIASGIGGGSADGAATLRLLAHLAGGLPARQLDRLALRLGADGPMCLRAHALRARGIGDEMEPWPALPTLHLVLVNPNVAVSTPAVFRRLARRDNPPIATTLPPFADAAALASFLTAETRNDLEPPAIEEARPIAMARAAVAATEGCLLARMSGSGATVFGIYSGRRQADDAATAIRHAHPAWWTETARTIAPEDAMPRGLSETV